MEDSINYFIWGYQRHFRLAREFEARRLFQSLDQRFDPEIFLIGVRSTENEERHPACVEPEDDFWIDSENFARCMPAAKLAFPNYRESQILISDHRSMLRHQENTFRRALANVAKEVVDRNIHRDPNKEYFLSLPVIVNDYYVMLALGLERQVINSHPRLTLSIIDDGGYREIPVARSLIDATVAEFLTDTEEALERPDPGSSIGRRNREVDDTVQAAGRRLMRDIAYRADSNELEGQESIFRACNVVSSLMYEKGIGVGRLVIAEEKHESIRAAASFSLKPKMTNHRGARKLLETSSAEIALHTNSKSIIGLAEVNQYDGVTEDLFEVQFLGYQHWHLRHAGRILMVVKHGQPQLLRAPKYEAKLPRDLRRIFRGISGHAVDSLVSLVKEAEKQAHGTLMVITAHAAEETARLSTQCTRIEPRILTAHLLKHLSSVDGAILLEPNCMCHAFGVILDGIATDRGDPSRGARFNSAVRFIESSRCPALAIVVSEDGGVDLIPDLKPAIYRREIDSSIQRLEEVAQEAKIPWRKYRKLLEWFEERRFYLLEEDCLKVNAAISIAEETLNRENQMRIRVVRSPFARDPEMCENMYYEERLKS